MANELKEENHSMSVQTIELPELEVKGSRGASLLNGSFDAIKDVKVKLQVIVGEAELSVEQLFALKRDSVVELSKPVSSPVEIVLDGKRIARGHLVAAGDNFGVRISEILK
jgi:flagellar motor switch protein FliN/FliY